MHRTMITLPDDLHKDLKRITVEQEVSVSQFVREAIANQLREDFEDLVEARKALARHKPGTGMPFDEYLRSRKKK